MHFKPKKFNSSIKWPVVSWLQKEQKISCTSSIILIIINKIYKIFIYKSWLVKSIQSICNSVWLVNMIKCNIWGLYCIYLHKINVRLVSKTLQFSVLKSLQTKRDAQIAECLKFIIKRLFNSFFLYHAQPHSIIANYSGVKTMDRPWSSMFLPWLFTGLPVVQFCL